MLMLAGCSSSGGAKVAAEGSATQQTDSDDYIIGPGDGLEGGGIHCGVVYGERAGTRAPAVGLGCRFDHHRRAAGILGLGLEADDLLVDGRVRPVDERNEVLTVEQRMEYLYETEEEARQRHEADVERVAKMLAERREARGE